MQIKIIGIRTNGTPIHISIIPEEEEDITIVIIIVQIIIETLIAINLREIIVITIVITVIMIQDTRKIPDHL
jgi:hypothetical protein